MDNQGEITYAEVKEIIGKTGKYWTSGIPIERHNSRMSTVTQSTNVL